MSRNLGLDVIRSCAIIMVLISHSKIFFYPYVQEKAWLVSLGIGGFYGVELFFVLSGFLIGQILLREVIPNMCVSTILTFYVRRWLRTLPSYYIVLLILIFAANAGMPLEMMNFHPLHFVFLQNFSLQELNFFGVSWSLSVEEWFYLLIPLLFACCLSRGAKRESVAKLLVVSIFVINIMRIIFVLYADPTWNGGVRILAPLRFDSLLFGLLLAHIKQVAPAYYIKLNSNYIVGIAVTYLFGQGLFFIQKLIIPSALDHSVFARTILFTLTSFFMALCIPFFEKSEFINSTIKNIPFLQVLFTKTSLYSYTIYLIHLDIFTYLTRHSTSLLSAVGLWALGLLMTCCMSAIVYKYYEKPIMDLREKISNPMVVK